jgi:hypothetical protein
MRTERKRVLFMYAGIEGVWFIFQVDSTCAPVLGMVRSKKREANEAKRSNAGLRGVHVYRGPHHREFRGSVGLTQERSACTH